MVTAVEICKLSETERPGLRLEQLLGLEYSVLLAVLLEQVKTQTGFGCVEIILADGGVVTMKKIESYRAKKALA